MLGAVPKSDPSGTPSTAAVPAPSPATSFTACAKPTEPPSASRARTPPPPAPFERMPDDVIEYIARHLIALKPNLRHAAACLARASPLLFIPAMTALMRNVMNPFSLTPTPAKDGYSLSTLEFQGPEIGYVVRDPIGSIAVVQTDGGTALQWYLIAGATGAHGTYTVKHARDLIRIPRIQIRCVEFSRGFVVPPLPGDVAAVHVPNLILSPVNTTAFTALVTNMPRSLCTLSIAAHGVLPAGTAVDIFSSFPKNISHFTWEHCHMKTTADAAAFIDAIARLDKLVSLRLVHCFLEGTKRTADLFQALPRGLQRFYFVEDQCNDPDYFDPHLLVKHLPPHLPVVRVCKERGDCQVLLTTRCITEVIFDGTQGPPQKR
ncbi:hypothetical protein AMAG_15292 [Allomyces macrogynus ATCC 38327]|uniref:Uncharacterized protein n=1 Tax=Allomyces macrogynus (strain ATCC 38327) TaxID=578462 RepID=A0A0L0T8G8_ALLM3|nr:hypothetical protein AMAG_15292 [Allomyces macrogynus ATCC 38327]|eukprot:KNE71037.1 hypothetical protein AMAG_15292 [Allomyces macrogynus ATCC 38327]